MKNNSNATKMFHKMIRAKHVFIDNQKVFVKKEVPFQAVEGENAAEWFPTDFKWMPVR